MECGAGEDDGGLAHHVGEIAPDGVVTVANARWRARTNRATPVAAGAEVRVVAIDGVTLEVEPAEGGARDYRERRPSTGEQDQISQLTPSETVSAD